MALQELSYYIIEPTADAVTSDPFRVSESLGPWIFMDKDVLGPGGNWHVDMLTPNTTEDWVEIEDLSSFEESFLLPGDGIYRVRKGAGSQPYGIFINRAKVSPEQLIVATVDAETSATSVLIEDRPATFVFEVDGNTNTEMYLEILTPDDAWTVTNTYFLEKAQRNRKIKVGAKGVYRISKSDGDAPVGVFVYR